MKLSISNIGWDVQDENTVFDWMKKYGYSGLEIAPTRIFQSEPYQRIDKARKWSEEVLSEHGFVISSMQSIWFGRREKLFGMPEERRVLLEYTKKAIDFAEAVGCKNLVFGSPRNRNVPEDGDTSAAVAFFKEIGDYAAEHNTVVTMEANPPIYNTDYINDMASALKLIKTVDSPGFLLNLDVGTMIENGESVEELTGEVHLIHHVHISEPGLKPIARRFIHQKLKELLLWGNYQGYVSIEMSKTENLNCLKNAMAYVKEIFQ